MTRSAAIPTHYRGIEYRSRLEARWAAFFTELGWTFTYEPFDGHGYIPDFLLHGRRSVIVEVKPAVTADDYYDPIAKAASGLAEVWNGDILIVGAAPVTTAFDHHWSHAECAGLLGEAFYDDRDDTISHDWDVAIWARCQECSQPGIFHNSMTYTLRPCGHYDGDHHLGPIDRAVLDHAWANACNDVKWRAA